MRFPDSRAKVPPEILFPRRLAARALELVLAHLGATEAALKINPDNPEQAFPGPSEGEVRLYEAGWDRGQQPLAAVYLEADGSGARVVIPDLRRLMRPSHRRGFRVEDLGIERIPGMVDVEMEVDLSPILDQWGEQLQRAPARPGVRRRRGAEAGSYTGALRLGRGR